MAGHEKEQNIEIIEEGAKNPSRRRFLRNLAGIGLGLLIPNSLIRASAQAMGTSEELWLPNQDGGDLTSKGTIFLTFDDGYIGLNTKTEALKALGVKATFFLTGEAIEGNPRAVNRLVNSGHSLKNHTYSHPDLTRLGKKSIADQINRCEKAAMRVASVSTKPYMRPPFGARNEAVSSVAAQLGYQTILWDWDTKDWAGTSAAHIRENIKPGVVLMHTQGRNTVRALENVVPALASKGYRFAVL